jgi:hypothetical protein
MRWGCTVCSAFDAGLPLHVANDAVRGCDLCPELRKYKYEHSASSIIG